MLRSLNINQRLSDSVCLFLQSNLASRYLPRAELSLVWQMLWRSQNDVPVLHAVAAKPLGVFGIDASESELALIKET